MHIRLNNEIIALPDSNMTVKELLKSREINEQGTAVAVNGRLVERKSWDNAVLGENDDVVIISAAFGG